MTESERDALIEACVSAYRRPDPQGTVRFHPAWYDLDETGRIQAADAALASRKLEAALDSDGLSTTARAVLRRITHR